MRKTVRWAAIAVMAGGLSACGAIMDPDSVGKILSGGERSSERAMAALDKGDYSRAENQALDALKANPNDPYALYALAVVYQNTGRMEKAAQYYQALMVMNPPASVTIWNNGMAQRRSIAEASAANLAALGVPMSGSAPQPMTIQPYPSLDQRSSNPYAPPAMGMMPPAVPVSPAPLGAQPLAARQEALIRRFQTLQRLLDEGLITREEYDTRRSANIGALLPYSQQNRPAALLDRPAPEPEAVVARLRALAAGYREGSISGAEQESERAVIINAILPPASARRADRPGPVGSQMQAAQIVGGLDRMAEAHVITPAEQARERGAVFAALARAEAERDVAMRMAQQTQAPGSVTLAKASPSAKGPGVQLGVFKTESQALNTWEALKDRYPDQLGSLAPAVRKSGRGKVNGYALSAGSLSGSKASEDLCRDLKSKGQDCLPVTVK